MSSPFMFEEREGNFFVLFLFSPLLVDSSGLTTDEASKPFVDEEGIDELIVPLLFSTSTSFTASHLVLGAASIVDGSTDSCVLSRT